MASRTAASSASQSLAISPRSIDVPAVGAEAGRGVVGRREHGVAVDGDVVVVVHHDQVPEPQVAGQRGRLVADALLEAAVAGDGEGVVVLDVGAEAGAELALGDGHADGVGEPLAERPGRHLDAGGVAALGVARRAGPPLAEAPQVVQLEAEAAQEQQRVLEDRGVAVGEDEAVAVGPGRVGRVEAHDAAEQHVTERRERHGRPLVAGRGGQRRVHGDPADEVDGLLIELGREGRHRGQGTRRPRATTHPDGRRQRDRGRRRGVVDR